MCDRQWIVGISGRFGLAVGLAPISSFMVQVCSPIRNCSPTALQANATGPFWSTPECDATARTSCASEQYCSVSNVEQLSRGSRIYAHLGWCATEAGSRSKAEHMQGTWRLTGCSLLLFICHAGMSAQSQPSARQEQNLFACINGWDSCDRSELTQAGKNEVALASHQRNTIDCVNAWSSCDPSQLTSSELLAVAAAAHRRLVADCWSGVKTCHYSELTLPEAASIVVAERRRNSSNCWNGWSPCELSKLNPSELSQVKVAQRRRNLSACWDGWATCDRSQLSQDEVIDVAVADHQRNYMACASGYTTCDQTGLTAEEATSLAAELQNAVR